MRKLVTIKTIDSIRPIENADAIESAVIGGWNVVVKKNEFEVGDEVLYFEIDSFLPGNVPEFEFLLPRGAKTEQSPITGEEVTGHVLSTAKLRGTFSQGLVLPLFGGLTHDSTQEEVEALMASLGVFKWESEIPEQGIARFPGHINKTDSERVQNLSPGFFESLNPDEWVATEKVDGYSTTFWKDEDNVLHVASRRWEVEMNDDHKEMVQRYRMDELMKPGDWISGELYGEGILKNRLGIKGKDYMGFHCSPGNPVEQLCGITHLSLELPKTIEEAVEQVNGMKSHINPQKQAEGVVWWHKENKEFLELDSRANFKAINNKYLLKNGG